MKKVTEWNFENSWQTVQQDMSFGIGDVLDSSIDPPTLY